MGLHIPAVTLLQLISRYLFVWHRDVTQKVHALAPDTAL